MNSNHEYSLATNYMWYKMILESFQNQTSRNDTLGYFQYQHKIRSDVFDNQNYFLKTCKEHTISLKKAFENILDNNCELPTCSNDLEEQIHKSEFVFGYDKSIEFGIFGEKILLIGVEDFDNIISALDEFILRDNNVNRSKTKQEKQSSFKYKKYVEDPLKLNSFFRELKRNKRIHQDTKLKDFQKVFSGKDINIPIIWTGNKSELYYLVKMVHDNLKLVEDLKKKQWEVAVNCFMQENGKRFERRNLSTQKKPESTYKKIDSLLDILK